MGRPTNFTIVAAFALVCLIWGTTWAVIKVGLQGIPPFSGVALRFAIASVLLLILAWAWGIKLGTSRREKVLWLVNGLLSFTISYGIVYWSEQWIPSGLAAVLFATYPLFVTLFAHFALPGESLRLIEVIGVLIGFGGVGVIFSGDFAALGGRQVYLASAVMLVSPLAASIATIILKRWGSGIHPFSLTAVPMGLTAGVMGALALAFEREQSFSWDAASVGALLYLAICGSAVTFFLYYWLLSLIPAKRLALTAYIIPLIAVIVGVLRGETLTDRTLLGGALVVVGVALAVHTLSPSSLTRWKAYRRGSDGGGPVPR